MKRKATFNRIAPFYDALAFLVFGNRILHAQTLFLDKIPAAANVLVLGGGTGRFLPCLLQINSDCHVWYIDTSSEMIRRASQKAYPSSRIHFICGTPDCIPAEIKFDVVLTFFFLDLFNSENLSTIVEKIKLSIRNGGQWIVSDFVDHPAVWAQLLLKSMYLFFKWTCGIEARKLPDWHVSLLQSGFGVTSNALFYSGFIESCVFQKFESPEKI